MPENRNPLLSHLSQCQIKTHIFSWNPSVEGIQFLFCYKTFAPSRQHVFLTFVSDFLFSPIQNKIEKSQTHE